MKYLSRLTALLLAFVLLFSSSVGVIAESDISDLTRSGYDQMVSAAKEAAEAEAAAAAQEAASQPIINEGGVVYAQDIPEQTKRFDIYEVITDAQLSMGGETEITLPQSGKINLSAGTAAQWQIYIPGADMWVNIAGETGDTFALTYAVIGGMLSGGSAKVRALAGDSAAVANVSVAYGSALPPVEEEDTFVAEAAAASTFALRRSASTSDANAGIMLADTGDGENTTPVTYTVTVRYIMEENGEDVANPRIYSFGAGSDYTEVIELPTVLGYQAYYEGNPQDTLQIDIVGIDSDKTYIVSYKPAEVNYTVIHYKQNLNNDNYTEYARETRKGLTKDLVPEVAKVYIKNGETVYAENAENEYKGFYSLIYEKPAIAADGSTLVEVYYDRNYYLMNFELSGGYGVEPIYARYGTEISISKPTRMGYTFDGWTPDVPGTMPVNGGTYTAKWTAGGVTYTVVYWAENANDSDYSYWGYATKSATAGATVSGSDDFNGTSDMPKTGFHFDHADQNVTVKGDGSTVVNVYYKRNTYTLIFAYDGGDQICGGTHTHTNCTLICGLTEHEHSHDTCCTKSGFSHGFSCNSNKCPYGYEHEHSDSCYNCGQIAHSSHSVANGCYGMKFENIKYGADTSPWWNQAPGYRWKTTSSGNTAYTYAPAMPNGNLTVYGQTLSSSYKYTIHYYEEGTTNKVHEDNVYYRSDNGYHLTEEDYIAIPGFVCLASGSTYPDNNLVYTIYYRRQSYNLSFKNGSETKDGGTHLYQADISDTYYVPTYTGDDADAYTFGGWYTTEKYIDGTKFDFEKNTMPYNNLILYAKWVPVTHTVTFYLEEKKIEEGEVLNTTTVAHGAKVDPVPSTPTNGDYSFVGWFYKEDGVEKAFDFANMPVNKDLVVYGKWSSNVLKKYTVYYKTEIKNADGTVTVKEIADPTTGSERAGATKTFDAKGGEDLYEGYQVGYFPMVKSHSLKIDIEADETGIDGQDKNTYTFWYVQKDAVPYTVKYLDAETGNPVEKEKVVTDNRMAVVTENFVVVPGYMPDAYQKRLVIDITDGAVNEIIFKYTKDIEHAYYKITHYIQNLDGETWTEYTSSQEIGEIEKYYTDSPMTISGYTYDSIEYKVADSIVPDDQITEDGAKLTADGLEINLYYIRNRYPYQVRYLKEGTTDPLADPENGTELYGEVIYREPISIQYYEPVDSKGQSLNIRIEKETDADGNIIAKLNVITFYYKEKEVKINYEVVGPAGCGTVDTESETLKVLSGEAKGSTATAANNAYKFVGWYSDAACTEANRLSTDAKYVPTKADEEAWVDGTTFYAKFDWNLADLTISKSGLNHTTGDDRESAIFVVTDSENKEIATVAIPGNGSVVIGGLTVGQTYTVTELNSWTWRYTPDSAKKTVTIKPPTEETKVTFINSQTNNSWLGGDNYEINKFN